MYAIQPPQSPVTVRVFSQRFSATRRGARLARLLALHQLEAWGVPFGAPASEAVGAVVAELAANAVLHGRVPGRDFELRLVLDGRETVRIEVTDTRCELLPPPAPVPRPAPDDEGGRGLAIVEALSTRWGVVEGPAPLKTVWAEIGAGGL
ncbi:ATP-binding protein [Streptomyces boncukensis]|uniref:ATP-binding protein n=1 Tax=Streptomyces boncukensis TaxID=2711219 RepID=A0A6G4X723_9ACTN|nr:ATP-binding protein [Streptomyces boncukensis]NGO73336.1 ATP-binding protein [Streptomyces boncukensis]